MRLFPDVEKSAVISPCGRYRYVLRRQWDGDLPTVLFVCLNPSTADHEKDDPSVRRMIGFSRSWGYGGLAVGNLFALRATDPREMLRDPDPIGHGNHGWLERLHAESALTVAAWGNHGTHLGRSAFARKMLDGLHVLGLTKEGEPKHPLYLAAATKPVPWEAPS